jgi:hypothetical protein
MDFTDGKNLSGKNPVKLTSCIVNFNNIKHFIPFVKNYPMVK